MPEQTVPITRYAFFNGVNIAFLAMVFVAALVTRRPQLLFVGLLMEAAWLVIAQVFPPARAAAAARHRAHLARLAKKASDARIAHLSFQVQQRITTLQALGKEIDAALAGHDALDEEYRKGQREKIASLIEDFTEAALACDRLERFRKASPLAKLEAELAEAKAAKEAARDASTREALEKNHEILAQRIEQSAKLGELVVRAQAEMKLIENTLVLLRDQSATMEPLTHDDGRLDSLLQDMQSTRAAIEETETLLQGVPVDAEVPLSRRHAGMQEVRQ